MKATLILFGNVFPKHFAFSVCNMIIMHMYKWLLILFYCFTVLLFYFNSIQIYIVILLLILGKVPCIFH